MGYLNPDPYSQPEKFGLTYVAMVDWDGDEACNEFSVTQVWKHEDGLFWWADDAGCSCSSPFEYFDQDEINKGAWGQVIQYLQSQTSDQTRPEVMADVVDAIQAILNAR